MSVSTDDCKKAIVAHCVENAEKLKKEFSPPLDNAGFQPALNPKNWKREAKYSSGMEIIRDFDCRPFDDQLRAYVYSTNDEILRVVVQGE